LRGRISAGLADAVAELRELSRGIHPAILSQGGLGPALTIDSPPGGGTSILATLPLDVESIGTETSGRTAERH
jgi:hypothetical protein